MKEEIMTDSLLKERIMSDLNKTVLITGSSSGIGLETAKKYKSEGFRVFGIDRAEPTDNMGCDWICCDISDEHSVKNAIYTISRSVDSINYLINSAGSFFYKERTQIEYMTLEEWNNIIANNTTGTMLVTKYAIPLLRAADGDKAIVNISSDQVFYPRNKNGAYSVSKAGIDCLSRVCSVELLGYGIRVNSILPSSVRSNFINGLNADINLINGIYAKEDQRLPLGLIEPQDVAECIFFLGSPLSKRITGQSILINSGLYI